MSHNYLRSIAAAIVALPLLTGCLSYTRIPVDSTPVGSDVRMVVTRQGAAQLISVMDVEGAAPTISGTVEGREGQSLVVRVPLASDPTGVGSIVQLGQVIRVPEGEVLSMELASFSAAKTGALIGASALVAAGFVYLILDAGRGNSNDGDPDPDVLFTILKVPIG